ncbi:transposase [Pseudofrankia asymbiotica]|uniref:transposase n=1 Tax=Pseudofrankia asymbiotica TaxID=1834516 RepID=UPI0018E959A2
MFGPTSAGETAYAATLAARALRAGMIVLADRGFAGTPTIKAVAATGADLLIRVTGNRQLPVLRTPPDGSWISWIGPVELRVIRCEITVTTTDGTRRTEHYLLVTTVLDPSVPAAELIRPYHDRWEVETAFLELKSTILGGEVLRSRTPDGVEQEIYALLVTYQAVRIAIADAALGDPALDPDRGSFTTALQTARDQLIKAAGVTEGGTIDLVGVIGRAVLADLLPDRCLRVSPRVVKRAISNYAASTAKSRLHGPNYKATLSVDILTPTP